VIIASEKTVSTRIAEADDETLQKLAWELFRYLSTRGLPRGRSVPDFDETVRRAHAK
jgi:hypothetical protein